MTAREYVECTACGHAIEQHDTEGCMVCYQCETAWTVREIMEVRAREGLRREWRYGR